MNIQLVRNATLVLEYAGKKFLIDPMLAEKEAYPPFGPIVGFPDAPRQDVKNPINDLPMPIEQIILDIDAVIVTHLHLDHFDDVAKEVLPKDLQFFVQSENDATEIKKAGFAKVSVLPEEIVFEGITLTKTAGEHGRGKELLEIAGPVMGVVLKHPEEKTLYVTGDTVWYEDVQTTINNHHPEVIVVNSGDNYFNGFESSLIMGKEDVYEVTKAAPDATIVAVHMEAVNHWGLSREELKHFSQEKGLTNVLVPDDGEAYSF